MSELKNAQKLTGVPEPQPTSGKKGAATPKPKKIRQLNPLPESEVGQRLLVRLQAEEAMTKLKLKERWEDPLGWKFDELCAVVAAALGESFLLPGEKEVAERVIKFRNAKVIEQIRKHASPALVHEAGDILNIQNEAYEGMLILGMGTPVLPIEVNPHYSDIETLIASLASAFEVPSGKIDGRKFERAKRRIRDRYAEHLSRQQVRLAKEGPASTVTQSKLTGRSQRSLLHEALGKKSLDGKLPLPRKPQL